MWHKLSTCLWSTPFPLAGFQDLSKIYPDLEDFFVRRLRVKKASTSMLINDVKRMSEQASPKIDDIRARLIEIGMMVSKGSMDGNIRKALDKLKDVKFLPKQEDATTNVLVGVMDTFAIPDHPRYCDAFVEHYVMLDFSVEEVHILHRIFQYLSLTPRYLSTMVREVSIVEDDAGEDESLSQQLQTKAYALYWYVFFFAVLSIPAVRIPELFS